MKLREIHIEELKQIQLNILEHVHKFCEDNGVNYFLTYGTLIGAIRHKGYIPWDDDIDICMPRPDYDKFIKNFTSGRYNVKCFEKDKCFLSPFAKIDDNRTVLIEDVTVDNKQGVNIDLYPIDGIDNDIVLLKTQKVLRKLIFLKVMKFRKNRDIIKNIFLAFAKLLLLGVSLNSIIKQMVKNAKKHDYNRSTQVTCVAIGDLEPVNKQVFKKGVLADFETTKFYVPIGYDEYLKSLFGNYMKLPPEDKRVAHHNFKAYWKK